MWENAVCAICRFVQLSSDLKRGVQEEKWEGGERRTCDFKAGSAHNRVDLPFSFFPFFLFPHDTWSHFIRLSVTSIHRSALSIPHSAFNIHPSRWANGSPLGRG
jgi:hypothetical protein